jgi:hypothetical protein
LDDKKIKTIGESIATAGERKRSSLPDLFANVSRFGDYFGNKLPDDVEFLIVLSKKGEPLANVFVSSLPTRECIEKLKIVRDQMRTGSLEGSWGERKDPPPPDPRIIIPMS